MAATEKTPGTKEEDLSMEEILQSIRSIIAEDGTETPAGAAAKPPANGSAGSDVLELTEMVKDDGSVESLKAAPAAAAPATDVLSRIDEALTPEKKAAAPVVAAPAAPAQPPKTAPESEVLSAQAASTAAATFNKLKIEPELPPVVTTPSPTFLSGKTVEEMVAEMLRPMMKEWLDKNLPPIVERIVEREVKRLTK